MNIAEIEKRRDVLQSLVDHQTQVCLTDIVNDYNRLLEEIKGLRAWKRSIDEALNSGDGSYRP